jgi:hypothetical protein
VLRACLYVLNRSLYSTLDYKSPFKALNYYKPDLQNICILGLTAYNLIGRRKKKLYNYTVKGRLIRYNSKTVYYILLSNRRVIYGSNVYINK